MELGVSLRATSGSESPMRECQTSMARRRSRTYTQTGPLAREKGTVKDNGKGSGWQGRGGLTLRTTRNRARIAQRACPDPSRHRTPSAALSQSTSCVRRDIRTTNRARGGRTSNPASEIRNSISNLWLSAWFLIIATVRVVGETGLEMISPGAWVGDEGVDMVFERISCWLLLRS